eukprot:gnl/Chilomastix_cuspidata/4185.p1 GENE.gnl/Chilomastix_cuspidata/4185~~gnl/Chilomastix_cuspidata/4185.p1  ORF type:complete len:618 (+),score=145.45 gnl/Chilomastix_cuspidata/4185:715-2568(+)
MSLFGDSSPEPDERRHRQTSVRSLELDDSEENSLVPPEEKDNPTPMNPPNSETQSFESLFLVDNKNEQDLPPKHELRTQESHFQSYTTHSTVPLQKESSLVIKSDVSHDPSPLLHFPISSRDPPPFASSGAQAEACGDLGVTVVPISGRRVDVPSFLPPTFDKATVLPTRVLDFLATRRFARPTAIQRALVPALLGGLSATAIAPTGSGKTLAFLLPLAALMVDGLGGGALNERTCLLECSGGRGPLAAIVSPTREIAVQTHKLLRRLLMAVRPRNPPTLLLAVAGADAREHNAALKHPPPVVVGTPGKIAWLMASGMKLWDVVYLVVDEADMMLSFGFEADLLRIARACARARQTILLSATLRGRLPRLERELLSPQGQDAVRVEQAVHSGLSQCTNIEHFLVPLRRPSDRFRFLVRCFVPHMLGEPSGGDFGTLPPVPAPRALVLCARSGEAPRIAGLLRTGGVAAAELTGMISPREREEVVEKFEAGAVRALVATHLASRGLDLPVDVVLHWDAPRGIAQYVHSSGRTGRRALGLSILLLCRDGDEICEAPPQRFLDALLRIIPNDSPGVRETINMFGLRGAALPAKAEQCQAPLPIAEKDDQNIFMTFDYTQL